MEEAKTASSTSKRKADADLAEETAAKKPHVDSVDVYSKIEIEAQTSNALTSGSRFVNPPPKMRYDACTGQWLVDTARTTSRPDDPDSHWCNLPPNSCAYQPIQSRQSEITPGDEDDAIIASLKARRYVCFTVHGLERLIQSKLIDRIAEVLSTTKTLEAFKFVDELANVSTSNKGTVVQYTLLRAIRKNPHHTIKLVDLCVSHVTLAVLEHIAKFIRDNMSVRCLTVTLGVPSRDLASVDWSELRRAVAEDIVLTHLSFHRADYLPGDVLKAMNASIKQNRLEFNSFYMVGMEVPELTKQKATAEDIEPKAPEEKKLMTIRKQPGRPELRLDMAFACQTLFLLCECCQARVQVPFNPFMERSPHPGQCALYPVMKYDAWLCENCMNEFVVA